MFGKIDFEHVWKFQIGGMMSKQFPALINAICKGSADDVIVACLRLGWNDAFKHVSENTAYFKNLSEVDKNAEVNNACKNLVEYFKVFAGKVNTKDRYDIMLAFLNEKKFVDIFTSIKNVKSTKYPLCLGHIQKMFNMAMKLLLCLLVSAEHAISCGIKVKLGERNGKTVYLTDPIGGVPLLSYKNFPYKFDNADCPIDHIILESIEKNKTKGHTEIYGHKQYDEIVWSKLGVKEKSQNYISAQSEIKNIQGTPGKSNLCFDFENWK